MFFPKEWKYVQQEMVEDEIEERRRSIAVVSRRPGATRDFELISSHRLYRLDFLQGRIFSFKPDPSLIPFFYSLPRSLAVYFISPCPPPFRDVFHPLSYPQPLA